MMLHWSPRSPFVRKVMLAAHELSLLDQIELRRTVVRMGAPNPDLLPDNPLFRIPTLVVRNGPTLIESRLICEYFDSLAGGGVIIPASGDARWRELALHELATGLTDVLIIWRNEREKPPERRTQAWLDAFELKTESTMRRLGETIAPIGPGKMQLSQMAFGAALGQMDFRFSDTRWRERHPAVAKWQDAFKQTPSAIATEIVPDG